MQVSPVLFTESIYSALPHVFDLPYKPEISDIVSGALSVAVNILGPRNDSEKHLYTDQAGQGPSKARFKAHKMLFVYGTYEDSAQDEVMGFGVRWIIGIAAFMLGNVSAPLTGQDLSMRRFAVSEMQRIDEEMELLVNYRQYRRRTDVAKAFTEMLLHERHIFVIVKRNAESALFLRVTLIVFSILATAGAFLGLQTILTVGTLGMFSSGCLMLFKTGLDSTGFEIRQEAAAMRRFTDYVARVRWLTGSSRYVYPTTSPT